MKSRLQYNFFLLLLIVATYIVFLIIKPLLAPLLLAVSLGLIFLPIHKRIVKIYRGQNTLAALTSLLIVIVLVLIPVCIILYLLFGEAVHLYAQITAGQFTSLNTTINTLNTHITKYVPGFNVNLTTYVEGILSWVIANLGSFFSEFFSIALKTFLFILTLFYFFQRGGDFKRKLIELSPLPSVYDEQIISRLSTAVVSVIRGSLIIGVIQGLGAGIGTAIFGMPSPVIWGVTAGAASFIPGIGTLVVMGPAIISRFVFGHYAMGIGLLIWYICTLILVDNMLSPYIIERGTKIHSLFILIFVLGGLVVFGPIGFILGPLFLAFFFALLEIYPLIIKSS